MSSRERGLCPRRPTTPWKYTLPVVVVAAVVVAAVVVDAVVDGVVDVDAVDVAVSVTSAGDDAGVRCMTVLVVAEPHDASASTAPAASRPRPVTRRSYVRPRLAVELLCPSWIADP